MLVVVIGGPTGVGKSELALRLARRINGELISCDSVQVFRGLNIGSNKTAPGTPQREHLLDVVDWWEPFTAADFYTHCHRLIGEIHARGHVPIIVGGTGFYMDWLLRGRPQAPPTDAKILKEVEGNLAADCDWTTSLQRLQMVDPFYAASLLPNDFYRLKRALCVYQATGQPLSSFKRHGNPSDFDFRCFYLTSERRAICRRIDERCEDMLRKGLFKEVLDLGLKGDCQAGKSIGYAQVIKLFEQLRGAPPDEFEGIFTSGQRVKRQKSSNETDRSRITALFHRFLENFKSISRQYSRKQESWFARKAEFKWLLRPQPLSQPLPEDSELVDTVVEAVLSSQEQQGRIEIIDRETRDQINSSSKASIMKEYRSCPCQLLQTELDAQLEILSGIGRGPIETKD